MSIPGHALTNGSHLHGTAPDYTMTWDLYKADRTVSPPSSMAIESRTNSMINCSRPAMHATRAVTSSSPMSSRRRVTSASCWRDQAKVPSNCAINLNVEKWGFNSGILLGTCAGQKDTLSVDCYSPTARPRQGGTAIRHARSPPFYPSMGSTSPAGTFFLPVLVER